MSTPENSLIVGMGGVCAAGKGCSAILESFGAGRREAAPPTVFRSSLRYPVFEVSSFTHDSRLMRTLALAYAALEEACEQARLPADLGGMRTGVVMGTTVASQLNDEAWYGRYREKKGSSVSELEPYFKGNLAGAIASKVGSTGPAVTVVNACSSGADALGIAYDWLSCGVCDLVIAGGADELNHVPYCGFGALSVTSASPCRPFDKQRSGLNLGEGAGIMVLERPGHAHGRGMESDLFLAGFGAASDAYHLTAPRPNGEGLTRAIQEALRRAGCESADIAFINAHGTATRDNDAAEGGVIARLFGREQVFLSTKGYTGHTLGAAGALEAVFTALALREGWVPQSIGFTQEDESIGVAPVAEKTAVSGNFALSTSLAFGGNNAAVVIKREPCS
ncbi:MAG: beta-ketoacyl-[acyl-carrier-protein] synthase family protein [Candidatus Omnitrophica bacterium]|nr:beta-ketoacyl-[acyl-carrier-protein] synthase family protein [Candidatus Omnitrophota bacterium]